MQDTKTKNYYAYLAGFLDGDGSIYVRAKKNPTYKYGFQIAPYIIFFQSKKVGKNFEKIFSQLEIGYMRERRDGILEYTIAKKDDIKFLIYKLKPYLILKRRQADLILKIIEAKSEVKSINDFQRLMNLVDEYRSLNYSTNRKKHKLTP